MASSTTEMSCRGELHIRVTDVWEVLPLVEINPHHAEEKVSTGGQGGGGGGRPN